MSEIWTLEPRKCRKCGKEIFPTPQWVYKDEWGYYCSWKCFNHRFDGLKKKDQKNYHYKPVEQLTLDGEPVQIFENAYAAAAAVDCSIEWLRRACRIGEVCKNHLWQYVEEKEKDETTL